jgi:hypothetical protein
MLKIHATGDWPAGAVHIRWAESTRAIVPEVESAIERCWSEAKARRPHVALFDGPMCRLESFHADSEKLELALSRTSYKAFFGTNMSNPDFGDRFGESVLANPVGLSLAIVTSDGYFMLGRRNASVAYYANRLHPFAGASEPREGLDIFDEVRRELREELSLMRDEIADLRCIGMVEDISLRQPELIFAARTTRTRARLEAQVNPKEHSGAWATPATAESLRAALAQPGDFTPVAIATMQLWAHAQGWLIMESEYR